MEETEALWRELLQIPDNYRVIFLGGGASTQFYTIAANLLGKKAAYLQTGVWAKKAIKEAKLYGEVEIVASSEEKNYTYIPKGYNVPLDADYLHITTNNTIYGTEIKEDFDCPIMLVADMSSDIMSRPIDVAKYGLIYGGAQKNVGPAGVTFVIIREDILGKVDRTLPTMVDYRTHIKESSMFNTPPVFPIFVMHETLKWIKELGGLKEMNRINSEKAELLYSEIDRNPMFTGTAEKADRSIMNICFVMSESYKEKEADFMAFAKSRGMIGIKGHRSVGGFRASLYNACPLESVQALVDCMRTFEQENI
jgi:phosphoserine aminotransferase